MITLDALHGLFDYHRAQYARIWDSIDTLTDAQFVQPVAYGIGSLRNHMIHLASVEQRWLARITATPLPDRLAYADYPDRATARAAWDAAMQDVRAKLDTLTADDLARTLTYAVRRVDPPQSFDAQTPIWQILLQLINHGTDHRAQMLRMLGEFGAPTFEQDLIVHLWDLGE